MGDLWDFEANQKKLASTNDSNDSDLDVDLDALDDDKIDKDEDVDTEEDVDVGTKEDKTDVDAGVKPDVTKADESGLSVAQQKTIADQVLKLVGPDAILKVKGVERKASELTPQELTVYLQKGMNADRLFQEHALAKKELSRQREIVEQGATALQEYLREHPAGQSGARTDGLITSLPDYLKPHADDTPEVQEWKMSQVKMLDEFNTMKSYILNTEQRSVDQQKVNEIVALRETYPMASVDEVLAIKQARPNIDSEEIMRASHGYYSGADFVKKALASNPTFKREYDAEVIKGYLAKKSGAPKIPGKKVHGGAIEKVSFGIDRKNVKGTFEDADKLSRQYLSEIDKMEKES